jgi:hypothetical protein
MTAVAMSARPDLGVNASLRGVASSQIDFGLNGVAKGTLENSAKKGNQVNQESPLRETTERDRMPDVRDQAPRSKEKRLGRRSV